MAAIAGSRVVVAIRLEYYLLKRKHLPKIELVLGVAPVSGPVGRPRGMSLVAQLPSDPL